MNRLARQILVLCAFTGAAAPASAGDSAEVAPSAADVATARELFREAARLTKEEKWKEALDAYQRSMALRPSNLTRYSIAFVQERMGKLVEAMESLRAFIEAEHDRSTIRYVETARTMLSDIESRIARVKIVIPGNPRGATVLLDGDPIPAAAIGVKRPTDPGKHHIEARIPGHARFIKDLVLPEGADIEVLVNLTHASTDGSVTLSPSQSEVPSSGPSAGLVLTLAGAGVFTTGLGLGIYGYAKAKSADSRDGSDADTARTMALVGDFGMGVGLISAGIGTYLLMTDDKSAESSGSSSSLVVSPWAGEQSAGIAAAGRF